MELVKAQQNIFPFVMKDLYYEVTEVTDSGYYVMTDEGYSTYIQKNCVSDPMSFYSVDKLTLTDIVSGKKVSFIYPQIQQLDNSSSYLYFHKREESEIQTWKAAGVITVPTGWYSRLERNYKREKM
jgi:hypothetical protein